MVGWRFIDERRAVNLDPNCGWARGKADVLYVADAFEVMRASTRCSRRERRRNRPGRRHRRGRGLPARSLLLTTLRNLRMMHRAMEAADLTAEEKRLLKFAVDEEKRQWSTGPSRERRT